MTNSKLFIQKDLPVNWHQEYITPNLIQAEEILKTYVVDNFNNTTIQ